MKCPSCGYENKEGARYCGLCEKPFGSFANEPSVPYGLAPSLEPKKGAAQKVLRSQSTKMNWFQRHLNLTWVFAQWAAGLIIYFIVFVFAVSLVASGPNFPSEPAFFASMSVIQIVGTVLQLAAQLGVGAWVLRRKNRSLGWLLIFFVPLVGWIIFLFLENRSEPPALPVSSGLSAPSSSIQPGLAPPGLGSQYGKYGL